MSNVPTTSWDETSPSGSQAISLGDDRIREAKTQVREIIAVDHEFASSGQTPTTGQHKRVTLQEQADLGTGAVGTTKLGNQTVAGKGELVYTDEDDNDVQITSLGKINAAAMGGVYAAANVAALATILNLIYPVGHIYIGYVSTNPNTLFGIGTWTAFAAGKVLVGLDAGGDTDFDVVGDTGGAKTVTLTSAQSGLPAHTHVIQGKNGGALSNAAVFGKVDTNTNDNPGATQLNTAADAAESHTNMPPFITVYMWRRTA